MENQDAGFAVATADRQKSHETETDTKDFNGFHARLLIGGEAINPDKTDLPLLSEDSLHPEGTYTVLQKASDNERLEHWQRKGITKFEDQKTNWIESFKKSIDAKKDFFTNAGKEQADLYLKLGIDVQSFTDEQAENFYKNYFTGENKNSQIDKFINDIKNAYTENGTLNREALMRNIEGIKWLANVFGSNSAEIIKHVTDFTTRNEEEIRESLNSVNKEVEENGKKGPRINILNSYEKELLAFLWKHGKPTPQPEPQTAQQHQPEATQMQNPIPPEAAPVIQNVEESSVLEEFPEAERANAASYIDTLKILLNNMPEKKQEESFLFKKIYDEHQGNMEAWVKSLLEFYKISSNGSSYVLSILRNHIGEVTQLVGGEFRAKALIAEVHRKEKLSNQEPQEQTGEVRRTIKRHIRHIAKKILPAERRAAVDRKTIKENLRYLFDNYGIIVNIGSATQGDVAPTFKEVDISEAAKALRALKEEIAEYPREYIDNCHLGRIRIGSKVSMTTEKSAAEPVGGFADWREGEKRQLYLALEESDSADSDHFRSSVHHELFHMSDKNLEHSFEEIDEEWSRLNPGGKSDYLRRGYSVWHDPNSTTQQTERSSGFANAYGKENEWEDRATVAELLMTNPKEAERLAEEDPVLKAKIEKIKELYKQRSNGKMDDEYFRNLAYK